MSGERRRTTSQDAGGGTASGSLKTEKKTRRRGLKWFFKAGVIAGLSLCLLGMLGLIAAYSMTSIPTPNRDFQTETTDVVYQDGRTQLGNFVEQNRKSISLDKVPQHVQDAVVAAEDQTFWTNKGIDPKGILRAFVSNAQGNATQGASTITQQYVKVFYLSADRTLTRKAKEALVSLKLQRQYSKQQILEGYLNTIYFGRGAYGIEAAAQAYFQIPASQLNVRQGAALAAILNSPGNLDPGNGGDNRQELLGRYQYVLDSMASMGTLDATRSTTLRQALPKFPKIAVTQRYAGQKGFMLAMIRSEMHELGFDDQTINGGGLKITSTFSKPAMQAMRTSVLEQKPDGLGKQLHIGASSIDTATGGVLAVYGGQNYIESDFNWATAGGQPGSTFKMFALAAAMKDGVGLGDTFDGNSPYTLPGGAQIRNETEGIYANGRSYGSAISLTNATENSVNTAFIDLTVSMENGPTKIRNMAKNLGIPVEEDKIQDNIGISLGSERVSVLDMTNAYASIANEGTYHPWHVVQKVERVSDGTTLYQRKADAGETKPLTADQASDVSFALQRVVSSGTGTAALGLGRPAAGKTGTATNDKDQVSSAWFVGYTPQVATAVMYVRGDGNDQLDGWLPQYFGGSYPARTWTAIMSGVMADMPVEDFPTPAFGGGGGSGVGSSGGVATAPAPAPSPTKRNTGSPRPTQDPTNPTPTAPAPTAPAPTAPAPTAPGPTNPGPTNAPPGQPSNTPGPRGGGGGGGGDQVP